MKKVFRIIFCAAFCVSVLTAKSQSQFSGWLASFNTVKLTKKFSLHFDGQLRSTDQLQQIQTILLRPGINFHFNKKWIVSAGYAFVDSRRTVNGFSNLLPEHRIWQQAQLLHKLSSVSVTHRLRFEERFLPDAVIVNNELKADKRQQAFRFRYYVRSVIPFSGKADFSKGGYLAFQDEIFLNTGNKSAVNKKTFDQNRLYGGAGYRLTKKIDVEAGYMNQYTVTAASFTNNHILQLAIYKRL